MKTRAAANTAALIGLVSIAGIASLSQAFADPVDYTVYYTTYNGGQNVWRVEAVYTGDGTAGNGTFSLLNDTNIASTGGADGIVFNPNTGKLLIGGQGNAVHQVDLSGGGFTTATPGVDAYHLVVDPGKQIVWASSIPGTLSSVPINPFGAAGTPKTITGDDTAITSMAFTPSGTVFYTSSGGGGTGSFGTIDLSGANAVTTRILSSLPAAHGIQYDPFSGDLILGGADEIAQIDPTNPSVILSSATFANNQFDQGAVDGKGHIFWADNNGRFFFLDFSTTSLVGSSSNFVSDAAFKSFLDDIAPLIGAGGTNQAPEPATIGILGLGLAGLGFMRRRRAA